MGKRIVLCFDGTWNTPAENFTGLKALHARFEALGAGSDEAMRAALDGAPPRDDAVETNVCRLYRAVRRRAAADGQPGQVKWYDAGVGTHWYDRVSGGAFGLGLSGKIREGYRVLAEAYEYGDEVFLFGFSRGAYTARSLVGMIRNCGLLPPGATGDGPNGAAMMEAYELYRTRDASPDSERALDFRKRTAARLIPVTFLGVWDTVGALGLPVQSFSGFNRAAFEFHDTELSSIVAHAYHAVAVDEHREPYAPTLWDPKEKPAQVMEQRWFVGAHCDIGGGYESRALSDLTLRWMMEKAAGCGLELDPDGLPAVAPQNALGAIADSFGAFLGGVFRFFATRFYRPVRERPHGQELVDETVGLRLGQDITYRPQNRGLRDPVA